MIWHSENNDNYLYKKIKYDRSSRKNKYSNYYIFRFVIIKYEKK